MLGNFGIPLVNATVSEIDVAYWYNTACAINTSAQAGACGVMFFVVLVLAQAAKRRTPIFILNVLSLFFGFFRNLFLALWSISPWVKIYPYFSNDFSAIPTSAYTLSVWGTVFPFLMTVTVNLSLVLQAYTVTKTMRDRYRYMIVALSVAIFLAAVAFQFIVMVLNCKAIIASAYLAAQWAPQGALYTETICVWYFSTIFTSKLVYTLHYRKKHGWKQWSGVKILAAMGGCTMIIPCKSLLIFLAIKRIQLTITSYLRHSRILQLCHLRRFPNRWLTHTDTGRTPPPNLIPLGQSGNQRRILKRRGNAFGGLQVRLHLQQLLLSSHLLSLRPLPKAHAIHSTQRIL